MKCLHKQQYSTARSKESTVLSILNKFTEEKTIKKLAKYYTVLKT